MFLGGCRCWPSPKSPRCRVGCEYVIVLRAMDETGRAYAKRFPIDLIHEK